MAISAGSHPGASVHPLARALLEREGISVGGLHSKSWENLPVTPDIVITVCASAAAESCPAYLAPAVRSHWGVEDPAGVIGSDAQQASAPTECMFALATVVGVC